MITLDADITLITNSSVDVQFDINFQYTLVKLLLIDQDKQIEMDRIAKNSKKGNRNILLAKNNNVWEISANFIDITFLFYKDFLFQFFNGNDLVAESNTFKIEPNGKKDLYGIVNKLFFDFEKLWGISGTECILFVNNPNVQKCPYCWDYELNQRISTSCPHCIDGVIKEYIPLEFKARKIKTETNQSVTGKGISIINLSIYTTFSRYYFILGDIIFDNTTREFLEIKNAVPASVGGVRTSTALTTQAISINDKRVENLIPYI